MSMLSEKRKKKKWSLNPNGKDWSNDDNKYGQRMLEKMGWEKGKGLGVNLQGMKEHVKVSAKNDTKGLGCSSTVDELAHHQENFQNLLSELQPSLNEGVSTPIPETSTVSLEEKSKKSRARVHYQKFTRGKDVSRYSDSDLAGIFGKKTEPKNNTFEVRAYEDDSIDSSGTGRHESASTNIVKEPFTSSPDLCQDSDSYDEFSSSDTDRSIVHFPVRRRSRKKNVNTRREDFERGSQVQNSVKFPRVSVSEVVHVTEKIMSQENVFVNNHNVYPCDQKQKSIELVDLTDDLESVVKVPNVMSKKEKDIAVPKNHEKNVLKTGVSSTEVPFAVKNSNCTVIGAEAYVSLTTEEIDKCLEDLNQKEKEGKDKDKKEKPVKVNLKRRVQLYDNQLEINNSCVESTSDADSIVSIHEVLNEKDKVPADKQKRIVLKHIKLNLKTNTPVKLHKDFKIIVERYPVSHKSKLDNSLGGKAKDMAVPKNYEKNVLITGGSSTENPFPVENSNPSVVDEVYECLTAVAPNIHSDCLDNINDPDEPASNPKRKKLKRNCCESTALKGSVPLSTEPLSKHKIPKGNEDRVTKNAQKTQSSLAKRVLRSSVKSKMSMDKKSPNQEGVIKTAVQVNFKGSNIHLIPGYGCSQKSL